MRPLERLKESLEGQTENHIADVAELNEGETVKVGGLLSGCRKIVTKRGDMMLLGNLEDLTGAIPLVVFPKAYERCAPFLNDDEVVIVKGRLNRDFRTEELNILADTVEPLLELEKVRSLHVELVDVSDKEVLARMKDVIALHRGADPVFIRMDGKSVELNKNMWVEISPELVEQLEGLLGNGSINVEFSVQKKKEVQEVTANGN